MANPQAEDGHTDIAHELLEALAKQELSPNEWRVLMVIFRKTYGWHKKQDRIPLSQFVKMTSIKRQNVWAALRRLETRNLVIIGHDKKFLTYSFQKNYENWKKSWPPMTTKDSLKRMKEVIASYDALSCPAMTNLSWPPMTSNTIPNENSSNESKEETKPLSLSSEENSKRKPIQDITTGLAKSVVDPEAERRHQWNKNLDKLHRQAKRMGVKT